MSSKENIDRQVKEVIKTPYLRVLWRKFWKVDEVLSILDGVRNYSDWNTPTWWDFYNVLRERYNFQIRVNDTLQNVPQTWRVIIASDHPFPMADGLTLQHVLEQHRTEWPIKFVWNRFIWLLEEMKWISIQTPDPDDKKDISRYRWEIRETLEDQWAITIFPAWAWIVDMQWKSWAIREARKHNAPIVPSKITGSQAHPLFKLFHKTFRAFDSNFPGNFNAAHVLRRDLEFEPIFWEMIRDLDWMSPTELKKIVEQL